MISGSLLIGLGTYSLLKAASDSQIILQRKKTLHTNMIPHTDISNVKEGEVILMSINPNENLMSGILEINKKRVEQLRKIVINSQTRKLEEWSFNETTHWDYFTSHGINLNLGLANFNPPKNFSDILFTKHDKSTLSALTSEGLETRIKNDYNINLGHLPKTGIFSATFFSCGDGKPVFAVGTRTGDKFNSEAMGTDPKMVVDHVFKELDNANDLDYFFGTMSFVVGVIFCTTTLK